MRRTCDWRVLIEKEDGLHEERCGKPGVAHITWPGGTTYWYCAEHYDKRLAFIRDVGRMDVLRLSGVR